MSQFFLLLFLFHSLHLLQLFPNWSETSELKNANHKSSPGPDGVPFGILYHLSTTPNVMATLFNKVLATSAVPDQWGESIIKEGTTDDPSNFCPIALSNTVRKTFHLKLANRATTFLTKKNNNNLIDPSIQKAFLPCISNYT